MNHLFDENMIEINNMSEEDLRFAVGSARFILEDISIEKLADLSGLPEGVIAVAFDNIFIKKDYVRPWS